MFAPEELSPSAVEGRLGRPFRTSPEDDDDGLMVESISPPGALLRSVEQKPEGGGL